MSRMKTFLVYAILVIVVIVASDFLIKIILSSTYSEFEEYDIGVESPKVEMMQAIKRYSDGYIYGKVTNNTSQDINNKFIKIEFYSDIKNKLGTEYVSISDLKVNESKVFEVNYRYNNVYNFKLTMVDEKTEEVLKYHTLIENFGTYYIIARVLTGAVPILILFKFMGVK